MSNDVRFELVADESGVIKAFKRIEDEASNTGKQSGDNLSKGMAAVLGGVSGGIAAEIVHVFRDIIGESKRMVVDFVKESITASANSEAAVTRLSQSLASAGGYSEAAVGSFVRLAEEMQNITKYSSDAVLSAGGLARNFTRSNEEAQKLTRAAVELSAATGRDLTTSVNELGKAYSGQAGRLATLIPGVNRLTESQLKAGAATQEVLARFGGSAASQAQTFEGRMAILGNRFEKFKETLGDLITKSPATQAVIELLSKGIGEAIKYVQELGKGDVIKDLIGYLFQLASGFVNYVVAPAEFATNILKYLWAEAKVGIQGFIVLMTTIPTLVGQYLIAPILNAASVLGDVAGLFNTELGEKIKSGLQSAAEGIASVSEATRAAATGTMTQFIEEAEGLQNRLNNFDFASSTATQIEAFKAQVDGAIAKITTLKGHFQNSSHDIIAKVADIGNAVKNGLANAISVGVQYIAQSLLKGGLSFGNFAKLVIGALGDMAIQTGQVLVLTGLGIESLKALGGTAAIAAGIGLIAIGSILKSIGSGGGGAEVGGLAPGVGEGAGGGVATGSGGVATSPSETAARPGTNIAVNIQGNVFDKRETGLEIAKAINDSFDTNGTFVAAGAFA